MIEIQCTSCQTRYRIDERILPEDTPTFKCSRCGHVFRAEPRPMPPRRASADGARNAGAAKPAPPSSADLLKAPAPRAADAPARAEPPAAAPAVEEPTPPSPPPPQQQQETPAAPVAARPIGQAPLSRRPQAGVADRRAAPQSPPARRPAESPHPAELAEPPAPPEEPAAPIRHDTSDLLQRRFRDIPAEEAENAGGNLSFDFNDEQRSPDSADDSTSRNYAEEKWEVGDTDVPPAPLPRPRRRIRISDIDDDLEGDASLGRAFGRSRVEDETADRAADQDFERIRPEEVSAQARRLEAELRGRSFKLHSAGYFIGLFAMVIFGFGIVTAIIQSAPVASAGLLSALPIVGEGLEPPISAAQRVALGAVQAQYAKLKGNQTALVISGTAENLTSKPLGAVQIEAALTASSQEPLRRQAVYCGNSLSAKMIGEMTPHEIEFFEKLDAPKSFALAPQASAPFVIVFIAPPAGAGQFKLRVVRADPAAPPGPVAEGG